MRPPLAVGAPRFAPRQRRVLDVPLLLEIRPEIFDIAGAERLRQLCLEVRLVLHPVRVQQVEASALTV